MAYGDKTRSSKAKNNDQNKLLNSTNLLKVIKVIIVISILTVLLYVASLFTNTRIELIQLIIFNLLLYSGYKIFNLYANHLKNNGIDALYIYFTSTSIILSLLFTILLSGYFIGLMLQFRYGSMYLLLLIISLITAYYTLKKDWVLPLALIIAYILLLIGTGLLSNDLFITLRDFFSNIFLYIGDLELDVFVKVLNDLYLAHNLEFTVTVIVAVLTYFYFLQYLKKNGFSLFGIYGETYKYLLAFSPVYLLVTELIFYLLIFYLLTSWRTKIIEIAILSLFFIINFIISNIPSICIKIVYDYKSLSSINLFKSTEEFIEGDKIKNTLESVMRMLIGIFSSLDFVYTSLNMLFLVSIMLAILGIIIKFNVLSIIYIEVIVLFWYSVISTLQYIPKIKANITLNDNTTPKLDNVYIIEDLSKEYIVVLDETRGPITIMKNSIVLIERENKSKKLSEELKNINYFDMISKIMDNTFNKNRKNKESNDGIQSNK